MKKMLMPSMMCVDIMRLCEHLDLFEKIGVDALHIDVMDGHFVPNMQLGVDYCRYLARATDLPLDYHFMVEEPEKIIPWFPIRPGDLVSLHVEGTSHVCRALDAVAKTGAVPMIALNPGTPLTALDEVLDMIGGVLLMTVNPGYAGQDVIESTIDKIARLHTMLEQKGRTDIGIEVDGQVGKNFARMLAAGADLFVLGSSRYLDTDDLDLLAARTAEYRRLLTAEA